VKGFASPDEQLELHVELASALPFCGGFAMTGGYDMILILGAKPAFILAAGSIALCLSALPTAAREKWYCVYGPAQINTSPKFKLSAELAGSAPILREAERPDRWDISISNDAALIATKPVSEWSRATKKFYPDRAAAIRDTHPTGASLGIISIDKNTGLFQRVLVSARGVFALQEKGKCKRQ
jgi:hypothetical protein